MTLPLVVKLLPTQTTLTMLLEVTGIVRSDLSALIALRTLGLLLPQ